MDKLEQKVIRAEEASRILNSEIFNQAFDDVRAALLKTWEELPTAEEKVAQEIHMRIKCLADVKKALRHHIESGKMAEREITGRQKAAKAVRGAMNSLNPFATSDRNR